MSALIHFPGITLPLPPAADPRIAQYTPLARSMASRYLRRMGGQLELDDLVQIALTEVWLATIDYEATAGAAFGTYVHLRVINKMEQVQIHVWRHKRRIWMRLTPLQSRDDQHAPVELPSGIPNAHDLLEDAQLHRTVAALPFRLREAVECCYWDGLTLSEASRELGRSREATNQRRLKALRVLKRKLRKEAP
ncbi:MAG TPA: sigma-70 family RNA polymerase sigma factor [Polyangiaceae bacterium]|nr:sigma-70 family RNA polymerase sigma factor [Polyangiaceae bacterium]